MSSHPGSLRCTILHQARPRARIGWPRHVQQPKVDSPVESTTAAVTAAATGTSPGNLDVLFMIDNSSSMTVDAAEAGLADPGVHRPRFRAFPWGSPTFTSPSSRRTWARRATRPRPSNVRRAATRAIFRDRTERRLADAGGGGFADAGGHFGGRWRHGRRHRYRELPAARAPASTAARRSSPTSAASPTTPATSPTLLSCMTAARRPGLRVRAPARLRRARARRRRLAGARPERRLPAPGRPAGHHRPQQRGRLLRAVEHHALLAQRRLSAEHQQPAGADRQLSLQQLRPPLRRSRRRRLDLPHSSRRSSRRPTRRGRPRRRR